MTSVVWFKRDLRLHDHAPLLRAARRGPLVALHITEPSLWDSPVFDAGHAEFIAQSLAALAEALAQRGGRLVRRYGEAVPVLQALHQATGFTQLFSHEEIGQRLTWDRDKAVAAWCRARGVQWTELPQTGVVRRLPSRDGWAQRWTRRMAQPVWDAPAHIEPVPGVHSEPPPPGLRPRHGSPRAQAQPGGEPAGRALLDEFLCSRGVDYRQGLSSPARAEVACSRLSPHLTWGTLSLKTVSQAVDARQAEVQALRHLGAAVDPRWPGALQALAGRLRWHCHFMQKLEDEPAIEFQNFARSCDGLRPDQGEPGWRQDWFEAWCAGHTGYPMVDACQAMLHRTGWLNFRMRAMLVSFAAYHLWLHWRQPALFLARQFVDFEPGIHFSQCQMQSGTTGINTLRIYSPTRQAQVQDPDGAFIRRWLPALARVPAGFVHEPWRMTASQQRASGCQIGRDYPPPLVDHASAWRQARARLGAVRASTAAQDEADAIQQQHGSRRAGLPPTQARRAAGPGRGRAAGVATCNTPTQLPLWDMGES